MALVSYPATIVANSLLVSGPTGGIRLLTWIGEPPTCEKKSLVAAAYWSGALANITTTSCSTLLGLALTLALGRNPDFGAQLRDQRRTA